MPLDGLGVRRTADSGSAAITYADRGIGCREPAATAAARHATAVNGSSATIVFDGSGISAVTEKSPDAGMVAVTLDGRRVAVVNANAAAFAAQRVLYSAGGLTAARHTLTLTKLSGGQMIVDRFDVS